jgi:hypothetical protein
VNGIALALPAIAGVPAGARGTSRVAAGPQAPEPAQAPNVTDAPDSTRAPEGTGPAARVRTTDAGAARGRAASGVGYGLAAGVCFALLFIEPEQVGW